jgi:hypothetical protein
MYTLSLHDALPISPELYAKVIQPLDESGKRYLIHFTWVPPDMQVQLHRLTDGAKDPLAVE